MRMTPSRMSAEERRDEVVAAAAIEFAAAGYAGTSTEAIARRSGVSQPYLFQLFGTKKDLFIAAVRDCFGRTSRTFQQSGKTARQSGLDTFGILGEMGHAYIRLLMANPDLLRLQLQAYAACQDGEIRAVVREGYQALWRTVAEISGAEPKDVQAWFAQGMLVNVVASIGEGSTFDDYLASLLGGGAKVC
jgi:AcrR family transcriptional regulator